VRQSEMAIRTALGAGRGRLIRQLLAETLLVALLGGALGVLLAVWANRLIGAVHIPSFPVRLDYGLDWRVFAFALAAAVGSGVLAGISPAYRATRADVNVVLHGGSRGESSIRDVHRVRGDLMAFQVGGSLMLLIVAGLFVRSLQSAEHTNLGIDSDHVLNIILDPQQNNYDPAQSVQFYRELEARVAALPGVQSVSLASFIPIESPPNRQSVYVEDHPLPLDRRPPAALLNRVDSGYFRTLRIPILRGREFSASDDENAPAVAVINQTMAESLWPNEDPIGRRFSLKSSNGPFLEVVGVMQDGKYLSIGEDPQPYFCVPVLQDYVSRRVLQIRSSRPLAALGNEVRGEMEKLAPGIPVLGLRTMKESVASAKGLFIYRFGASLAAALGALGLALAICGVYGVVSYATAQRTHEIGIRRALGASSTDIGKLVLDRGMRVVIGGVAGGLGGAWVLSRVMAGHLLGISASDALTYSASTILICAVTLLACWIPARRAMRIDPMVALRHE
jgi:predicted permease